jgi:hypothetical protein
MPMLDNVGVPIWQVLGFLFSVAWLGPAEGYLHWMVPAAVALLLVPIRRHRRLAPVADVRVR